MDKRTLFIFSRVDPGSKIFRLSPLTIRLHMGNINITASVATKPPAGEIQILFIRRQAWLRIPLIRIHLPTGIHRLAPALWCQVRDIDIEITKAFGPRIRSKYEPLTIL